MNAIDLPRGGETASGTIAVELSRGSRVVVLPQALADVYASCGESCVDEDVAELILSSAACVTK
jgi:hypothetical protein